MAGQSKPRILIFGATGMLGSALFRAFSRDSKVITFGTVREQVGAKFFTQNLRASLISNVNFDGDSGLDRAFSIANPDIVINCVGIIKQQPNANNHLESLAINSSLPHRLLKHCALAGARLVHFSTDCVFSGEKGQYTEEDFADARDLYGLSKYLGEVDHENALTLRTSIIGHELSGNRSLLEWFLSQTTRVKGYRKAVFSGLTTIEVARVLREFVVPNPQLHGLYHLSSNPVNKYDLLRLVADVYQKDVPIIPDESLVIDRSLNSQRFQSDTGFKPRPWPELIAALHKDHLVS